MKRDIGTFLLYMRILLLSPYDAMSHRYWHEGLVNHCAGRYAARTGGLPDEMPIGIVEKLRQLSALQPVPLHADYLALLGRSHVVLSTAIHEFPGVAVLEAVAVGCLPVVPDALAYQSLPAAPSATDLAWS
ncbi:MAG: hypothetical protein ACI81O_000759 [Cyclobacteriaceae bacterium]|jgi:hypothetical protein